MPEATETTNAAPISSPASIEPAAPAVPEVPVSAPSMDAAPSPAPAPTRLPLSKRMAERLERDYTYHAPTPEKLERYVAIREKGRELATLITQCVPECRELHASLTQLELAIFQANAGIARNP